MDERQAVLFLGELVEKTSVDIPVPAAEPPPAPRRRRAGMTASAIPLPAPADGAQVLPAWEDPEIERRLAAHFERAGLDGE
ncbi:hypothetical protein ACFU3J_27775 [Streptomyces sp. NPDC057411]|uniref:hypothetical protein n=1 Tax=unclassified Streptomyces TaxID=2593676 RepID=UPI0036297B1A